jgi:hypothetical protein
VSEAIHALGIQITLLLFQVKVVFTELLECVSQVFLMLFQRVAEDESVVEVGMDEAAYRVAEYGCCQSLVCCRPIGIALLQYLTVVRPKDR